LTRIINVDGKYFGAKFKKAIMYLPVVISRKDTETKKEYLKILTSKFNKACDEEKMNETPILLNELQSKIEVNGVTYFPFLLGGTFSGESSEDIDYLLVNMNSNITKFNENIDKILYFEDVVVKKPTSSAGALIDKVPTSYDEFLKEYTDSSNLYERPQCCANDETKLYDMFQGKNNDGKDCSDNLGDQPLPNEEDGETKSDYATKGCKRFLFTTNPQCQSPMLLDFAIYTRLYHLLMKSTSFVLYVSPNSIC